MVQTCDNVVATSLSRHPLTSPAGVKYRSSRLQVGNEGPGRKYMKTVVSRAKAFLKVRMSTVRDAMKQLKLDGILLTSQFDLAYLTGFTGDDSIGVITEKDFVLITDFRYTEQAEIEAGWLKVVMREGKMSEAVAAVLVDARLKRVGFEGN